MIDDEKYINLIDSVYKVITDFSKLRNKSVLVIGATGTIGSFLIDTLMRRNNIYNDNIIVYAGSRSDEGIKKAFPNYIGDKLFIPFVKDISKELSINFGVDYIIHAGSPSYPQSFKDTPVEIMKSNIIGTANLLDYCKDKDTRFMYVSSGEVYGNYTGNTPINEHYLGYIDNLNPRSCYPISKRAAETLCISYKEEYGVDSVIVRPSHIYSPFYKKENNNVFNKFLESSVKGEDIIFKKGVQYTRSYTFIVDVITGILKVLMDGKNGETYNISNENSVVSLEDIAQELSNISNIKVIIDEIEVDNKVDNPMNYAVLDNSKLKTLGWFPLYDFKEGIKETYLIRKKGYNVK